MLGKHEEHNYLQFKWTISPYVWFLVRSGPRSLAVAHEAAEDEKDGAGG
mgnify:FL=1|jgi:hypothetical protein